MEKCVFDRCKDDIIKIITKADDSWDKNRRPRLFPIGMAGRNLPFSGVNCQITQVTRLSDSKNTTVP